MGNLSNNFDIREFECSCNCATVAKPDPALLIILEWLRKRLEGSYGAVKIEITSGIRCARHNQEVGGSPQSRHLPGNREAADIKAFEKDPITGHWEEIPPKTCYDLLDESWPEMLGLGLYKTWLHVDCRIKKARW